MSYEEIQQEIVRSIQNLMKIYAQFLTEKELLFLQKKQILIKKQQFSSYQELKEIEQELMPYFARIWHNELTNPTQFKAGESFKFLIHCPTVYASKIDARENNIISASLITDKHMGTFNKINYGLICSCNEENLLSISARDNHALVALKSEKVAQQYYYAGSINNDVNLYTKEYIMSLKFPNQIENELILENIKCNGDLYLADNKNVYSDISLRSESTHFLGVVLFEPASEKEKIEATNLAQKFNLTCIHIPINTYFLKNSIKRHEEKHIYNIMDINTLFYILKHLEQLKVEYNNLIISEIQNQIYLKSDLNKDYVVYDIDKNIAILCPSNDTRLFKIENLSNPVFSVDNSIIYSQNKFQEYLNEFNDEKYYLKK